MNCGSCPVAIFHAPPDHKQETRTARSKVCNQAHTYTMQQALERDPVCGMKVDPFRAASSICAQLSISVARDAPQSSPQRPPKRTTSTFDPTDILAVDQASIDVVYKIPEAELHELREPIESRKGLCRLSWHERDEDGRRGIRAGHGLAGRPGVV